MPKPLPSFAQAGYTLVEILVVVVIIGLVTASMTGLITQQRDEKQFAYQMELLLNQMRDKALKNNIPYGLSLGNDHYSWWVLPGGERQWVLLDEQPFKSQSLPESLTLSLEGEHSTHTTKDNAPVIIFAGPHGTPFRLLITPIDKPEHSIFLLSDGLNKVTSARQ